MSNPSSSADAERWLLGALLLEGAPLTEVLQVVSPLDFAELKHRRLFEALGRLVTRAEPIDFVTVGQEVARAGHADLVGGHAYIVELAQEVTTTAHAAHHAGLVAAQGQRRRVLEALRRAPDALDGRTVDETAEFLDQLESELRGIAVAKGSGSIETVRIADVQSRPIAWLWPNRIALGKLTLVIGDPGLGKSTLVLDIVARITSGSAWPECPNQLPPGRALIVTAEDGLEDTIRPRLEAAGADLTRVDAIRGVRCRDGERPLSLDEDLRRLDAKVVELAGLRLIVIDPLPAFLGRTESHRDADVRRVLTPLAALAERHGIAIVAILHLNKGQSQALYRAMGSVAFVAAARSVWAVAVDRQDRERRLFVQVKNNLGNAPGLSFRVSPRGGPSRTTVPAIDWDREPVTVTAEEALAHPQDGRDHGGQLGQACAFLREELASGPVPAHDVKEHARECGISEKTLTRAKRELGVEARKLGFGAGWTWVFPEGSQESQADELAAFDDVDRLRAERSRNGSKPTDHGGNQFQGAPSKPGVGQ